MPTYIDEAIYLSKLFLALLTKRYFFCLFTVRFSTNPPNLFQRNQCLRYYCACIFSPQNLWITLWFIV